MTFKPASKTQTRVRMGITGATGTGKTYSALAIAVGLGERIAVIDTEFGSASLYSDEFKFDVCELTEFSPRAYVAAIKDAARSGYEVCIIDSLTHAWNGAGGVLDIAGGKFGGWKEATPAHNELMTTLASMRNRMHIIATMRSKMDYLYDQSNPDPGKRVQKLGMAPIQRDETPYEFDIVGDLDQSHTMAFSKTRCKILDGKTFRLPGRDLAEVIKGWLSDGAAQVCETHGVALEWSERRQVMACRQCAEEQHANHSSRSRQRRRSVYDVDAANTG